MIDIKTVGEQVKMLEQALIRARLGQLRSLVILTIDAGGNTHAACEIAPEPILIPATIGLLTQSAKKLDDLKAAIPIAKARGA